MNFFCLALTYNIIHYHSINPPTNSDRNQSKYLLVNFHIHFFQYLHRLYYCKSHVFNSIFSPLGLT